MPRSATNVLLLCLLLVGLAACVSEAELRKQDEAQCISYGFKPNTADFASCLQRENLARRYSYPYVAPGYWYPYP